MSTDLPRLGPHDVGGHDLGPLDLEGHPTEDWHALAMALYTAAMGGEQPLFNAHEYRRAMESLPEAAHAEMEYHARAVETMVRLCIEKGFVTSEALAAREAEHEA
jgi:hypothetical protein